MLAVNHPTYIFILRLRISESMVGIIKTDNTTFGGDGEKSLNYLYII